MQKKGFLFISLFAVMIFIISACSVPPFNTEADIKYGENKFESVTKNGTLEIAVENKNGVDADIKKVMLDVYEDGAKSGATFVITRDSQKGYIVSGDVDGNSTTTIKVSLENLELEVGQEIKVLNVEYKDKNKNTIKLGEIREKAKIVSAGSSGSTGGNTVVEDELKAVQGLSIAVSGNNVTIKWAENSHAKLGYIVYRVEKDNDVYDKDLEEPIIVENGITTSKTEYNDRDVKEGYTYFYKVVATDGKKETPKQDIPKVATIEKEIVVVNIPAPQNVIGESEIDSATITWNAVTGSQNVEIIGYNIYIVENIGTQVEKAYRLNEFPGREDLTEEQKKEAPNVTKTTTIMLKKGYKYGTDKEIVTGKTYYVRVAAVRADNRVEGERSEAVDVYLYNGNAPVIVASSDFRVVPKGTLDEGDDLSTIGVKLTWVDKPGVIKYIIERSDSANGPYDTLVILEDNAKSPNYNTELEQNWYIDGSFLEVPGKEAYYKIRCVTLEGIGKPSGYVYIKDEPALAVPVITTKSSSLLVTNANGQYLPVFTLLDVSDEKNIKAAETSVELDHVGYKIYVSDKHDGEFKLVKKVPNLCGFEVNLQKDVNGKNTEFNSSTSGVGKYYIRVASYDFFGNESQLSLVRTFEVKSAGPVIQILIE